MSSAWLSGGSNPNSSSRDSYQHPLPTTSSSSGSYQRFIPSPLLSTNYPNAPSASSSSSSSSYSPRSSTPTDLDSAFPTVRNVASGSPYPQLSVNRREQSSSADFAVMPAPIGRPSSATRAGAGVGTIGDGRRPSPTPSPEKEHANSNYALQSVVWDEPAHGATSRSSSIATTASQTSGSSRSFLFDLAPPPASSVAHTHAQAQAQTTAQFDGASATTPPVPTSKSSEGGYDLFSTNSFSLEPSSFHHSPTPLGEPSLAPPPLAAGSSAKFSDEPAPMTPTMGGDDTARRLAALESTVSVLSSFVRNEFRELKEQVALLKGLVLASPAPSPSRTPPPITLRSPSPNHSPVQGVQKQHSLPYLNLPTASPPSNSSPSANVQGGGGPPSPSLSASATTLYHARSNDDLAAGSVTSDVSKDNADKDEQLRALTAQVNSLATSLSHLISSSGSGVVAGGGSQQLLSHHPSSPLLAQHSHLQQPPLRQLSLPPILRDAGSNNPGLGVTSPSLGLGVGSGGSPGIGISLSSDWSGNSGGGGNGIKHPAPRSPLMRPLSATGNSLSRQTSLSSGFGAGRQQTPEEDRRRSTGLGFGAVGQSSLRIDSGFEMVTSPNLGGGGNPWGEPQMNGSTGMPSPLVGLVGSSISSASNGSAQSGSLSGKWENLGIGNDLFRTIVKYGLGPPTKIQCKAIPCILRNQDIVSQAPSIQERIQSYVVPALQIVLAILAQSASELGPSSATKGIQVLIITATVDQAAQAQRLSVGLGGSLGIRTSLCVGQGGDIQSELQSLQKAPPHVLVGTPQKLLDLLATRALPTSEIRLLVIDECDQLIARNLSDHVANLVRLLPPSNSSSSFTNTSMPLPQPPASPNLLRSPMLAGGSNGQLPGAFDTTPRFADSPRFPSSGSLQQQQQSFIPIPLSGGERQTVILSCTVPQDVLNFASSLQLREPVRVLVRREGGESSSPSARSVKAYYVYIAVGGNVAGIKNKAVGGGRREASDAREWKLEALADLCEDYAFEHCVIFCSSVDTVEAVSYKLSTRSIEAFALHQDMGQAARHALMSKFRSAPSNRAGPNKRALVVYDALCRTLTDVTQVPLVINYDLPRAGAVDDYLPRIACATASGYARPGVVINFVTPGSDVERLRAIESHYRIKIAELPASFANIGS